MVRIIRLSVEQLRNVDHELTDEIEFIVQLQINIRQRLAVADSAEVEQLLSVDRKLSDEVELVIQLRSLFRQRLAIAKA
jgi:hypothetical protein